MLREDPTTLFTGAGMQPLMPYLLGVRPHAAGRLLVDSQPCLRSQDIDEVGDRRHTTFFEMLGNWSLGTADVERQVRWFAEFLALVGVDLSRLYVTCFRGSSEHSIPRDDAAAQAWVTVFAEHGIEAPVVDVGSRADGDRDGMRGGRVFLYDAEENWWSRGGGLRARPWATRAGRTRRSSTTWARSSTTRPSASRTRRARGTVRRDRQPGVHALPPHGRGLRPPRRAEHRLRGGLERIAAAATATPTCST